MNTQQSYIRSKASKKVYNNRLRYMEIIFSSASYNTIYILGIFVEFYHICSAGDIESIMFYEDIMVISYSILKT